MYIRVPLPLCWLFWLHCTIGTASSATIYIPSAGHFADAETKIAKARFAARLVSSWLRGKIPALWPGVRGARSKARFNYVMNRRVSSKQPPRERGVDVRRAPPPYSILLSSVGLAHRLDFSTLRCVGRMHATRWIFRFRSARRAILNRMKVYND